MSSNGGTSDPIAIHDDAFVMDGLSSSTLTKEYVTKTLPEAGVNAIHNSIIRAGKGFQPTVKDILNVQAKLDRWPNVRQSRTVEDLTREGELGVMFGLQDTTPLGDDPERVRVFEQLGVRVIQLTYNYRNRSGNGATERVDGGISEFGLEVIEAIESQGLLLDLSHAGPQTALEAVDAATQPTIISHANPREVRDHPRNVSDELIRAIAATGGTVGVNAYPDFVDESPTLDDLLDHVEYLADLVGVKHVSLGLDFIDNRATEEPEKMDHLAANPKYSNPPYTYPDGIGSAAEIPNITAGLLDRGFDEETVQGIMGENLLNVFRTVFD